MAWQYRDQCYDTEQQVIDAMVVDIHGRVVDFNGFPALLNAEAGEFTVTAWAVTDSGIGPFSTIPVNFVECGIASPFVMSIEQGAQIAVAIIAIWALAYGFRVLARMSKSDSEKEI